MTIGTWFTSTWLKPVGLLFWVNKSYAYLVKAQEHIPQEPDHISSLHMVHLAVCSVSGILIAMVGICFKWRGRAGQDSSEEWMTDCPTLDIHQAKGWKSINWEGWFARHKNRLAKSVSTSSSNSACAPLMIQGEAESPSSIWNPPTRYNTSSTVSSGSSSSQKTHHLDYSPNSEASSFQSKRSQVSTTTDLFSSAYSSKPSSSISSSKSFQWAIFGSWRGKLVRNFRDLRLHFSAVEKDNDKANIYISDKSIGLKPPTGAHVIANESVVNPVDPYSAVDTVGDGNPGAGQYRFDRVPYSEYSVNPDFVMDQDVIANIGTLLPFDCCDGRRAGDLSGASSFKDIIDPIYSRIPCCSNDQLANEAAGASVLTQWSLWQQSGVHSSCASDLERYPSTHIYYELPSRVDHHPQVPSALLPWQLPDRLADPDKGLVETVDCTPPQLPARHYGKSTVDLVDQLRRQAHFGIPGDIAADDDPNISHPDGTRQKVSCLHQKILSVASMSRAVIGAQSPAPSDTHQWCSELDVTRLPTFNNQPVLQPPSFSRNWDGFATSASVSLADSLNRNSQELQIKREKCREFYSTLHRKIDTEDDRPSIWSTALNSVMQNMSDSLSSMRHIDSELDIPQQLIESPATQSSHRPFVQLRHNALHHSHVPYSRSAAGSKASADLVSRSQELCSSSKGVQETRPKQLMSPLMERSIEDEEARRMLVNVF